MKVRRKNFIRNLEHKLILLGCQGSHSVDFVGWKRYYLVHPDAPEGQLLSRTADGRPMQVHGWSEDSCTVKGAKMMDII
jgi:hypothetical protein